MSQARLTCQPGAVPKEMGRQLNRAHEVRQIADYTGGSVELDDARELVEQASKFVNFMRATFMQS